MVLANSRNSFVTRRYMVFFRTRFLYFSLLNKLVFQVNIILQFEKIFLIRYYYIEGLCAGRYGK